MPEACDPRRIRQLFHLFAGIAVGAEPNGLNINAECGATHTASLSAAVKQHQADFGIALDGDGDRLLMADAQGTLYDGDQLLYAIVKHRASKEKVAGVAATLMTNLGMEHALGRLKLPFGRAKVGDGYVLELLQEKGWRLGGETSGHILCLDKHTTGDGIISALQVLHALKDSGTSLAEYSSDLRLYPQVLINVPIARRIDLASAKPVKEAEEAAKADMGRDGRIVLRPSGTEPLIRVMVESASEAQARKWAERIAESVKAASAL